LQQKLFRKFSAKGWNVRSLNPKHQLRLARFRFNVKPNECRHRSVRSDVLLVFTRYSTNTKDEM